METTATNCRYPQNLELKQLVEQSGFKHTALAKRIGLNTQNFSSLINGHIKLTSKAQELKEILSKTGLSVLSQA